MFLVLLEAAVLVADERRSPQIIFYYISGGVSQNAIAFVVASLSF